MSGPAGPTPWRIALGLLVVVHLTVLYAPDSGGAALFPGVDKVVHVATFASVTLAGLRSGPAARWWLPLVSLHAGVSELVQHWALPHRSGDLADVAADLGGVALGTLAAAALARASWGSDRPGPGGDADRTPPRGDAGAG